MNIQDILNVLESSPVIALAIMLATYISEDITLIATISLVIQQKISILVGGSSLIIGIVSGDIALYWAGYFSKNRSKWVNRQLEKPQAIRLQPYLSKGIFLLVLGTRFLPGFRLPCYLLCGMYHLSFRMFLFSITFSTTVWVVLAFYSINFIYRVIAWQNIWYFLLIVVFSLLLVRFLWLWFLKMKR